MPSTPAIDVGSLLARRASLTPDCAALTFAGRTTCETPGRAGDR